MNMKKLPKAMFSLALMKMTRIIHFIIWKLRTKTLTKSLWEATLNWRTISVSKKAQLSVGRMNNNLSTKRSLCHSKRTDNATCFGGPSAKKLVKVTLRSTVHKNCKRLIKTISTISSKKLKIALTWLIIISFTQNRSCKVWERFFTIWRRTTIKWEWVPFCGSLTP